MDDPEAEWAMDLQKHVSCAKAAGSGPILTQFKSTAGLTFYVVELLDVQTKRTYFCIRTAKKLRLAE